MMVNKENHPQISVLGGSEHSSKAQSRAPYVHRGLCYTCSLPLKGYYMDRISSSHTYLFNTQDSRSVEVCGTQAGFYFEGSSKATVALFMSIPSATGVQMMSDVF